MAAVEELFESLPDKFIALAETSGANYQPTNLQILYYLVKVRNLSGIYVTVNKPYNFIKKTMETYNIDSNQVYFIDAISKTSTGQPERIDNVIYVNAPKSLTEISFGLTELVNAKPSLSFLLLDSISTFLLYNDQRSVEKFVHMLVNMLRELDMDGVIVTLDREQDKGLIDQLSVFCDKVMKFD
jgi:KaiC/GvpD/RAD55 family RecA-like ATPase